MWVRLFREPFPYKMKFMPKTVGQYLQCLRENQLVKEEKDPSLPFPTRLICKYQSYRDADQITDYFTEVSRVMASVNGSPSPLKYWEKNKLTIYRKAIRDYGRDTPEVLRETLYVLCPEATNFKASLARKIYSVLLPQGGTVFDPFAGWGDRALAAIASEQVVSYTGIDCNPLLKEGYQQISKLDPKVNLSIQSITDYEGKEQYDLIFTSPPFWDYEIYNPDDPKQSIALYPSKKRWRENFLFPVLSGLMERLKPGGHLALYVGSTFRYPEFPDDIRNYLGHVYVQTILCSTEGKREIPLLLFQKE